VKPGTVPKSKRNKKPISVKPGTVPKSKRNVVKPDLNLMWSAGSGSAVWNAVPDLGCQKDSQKRRKKTEIYGKIQYCLEVVDVPFLMAGGFS
jgi:hypothetical protein